MKRYNWRKIMAFKVKPFVEVLAMTKEKLDEALAPIRARAARAKADMASTKIEEQMVNLEREIHEACAAKDLDFEKIVGKIDQYELAERKLKQINGLISELFPEKK
jgi:hypothetical protein